MSELIQTVTRSKKWNWISDVPTSCKALRTMSRSKSTGTFKSIRWSSTEIEIIFGHRVEVIWQHALQARPPLRLTHRHLARDQDNVIADSWPHKYLTTYILTISDQTPLKYLTMISEFVASFILFSIALAKTPFPKPIKTLVTFGDSYTAYPVNTGDRGTAWPIYAGLYGNLSVHDFAISGATCSNLLTPRPFGSVMETQLPNFSASIKNGSLKLDPADTVFTLWIGTNDVGAGALLTGQQANSSVSIVDTTRCVISWMTELYKQGWRNFIYQNVSASMVPSYIRIMKYSDASTQSNSVVLGQLVSQHLLGSWEKYYRVERVHDWVG